MDMSKLPKMSQTPAPPPAETETPPAPSGMEYESRVSPAGGGRMAEAWISIAIGAIILLMFFRPIEFLISPANFAQKYTFNDATGAPLTYPQTVFIWGDVAILAFAIVLIGEGLLLFTNRQNLIAVALGFTILTALLNAIFVVAMMMKGYGLQLWSAVAAAFGVYIAMFQWNLLKTLKQLKRV